MSKEYGVKLHKFGSILFGPNPRRLDFEIVSWRSQICIKFLKKARFVKKYRIELSCFQPVKHSMDRLLA